MKKFVIVYGVEASVLAGLGYLFNNNKVASGILAGVWVIETIAFGALVKKNIIK